jgi:ethanolamine utilization microcompartment shell protein EutS
MKNNPKRACEKLRSEKSCFEKLNSFWFKTSAQIFNLARAIFSCEKNLLPPNDYVLEGKKMVKQKINCLRIITGILTLLILMPQILAADPGHTAGAIGTGMFESGNYTFPDSLHIDKFLNVTGVLYVDPLTSSVGIGTTVPTEKLTVAGNILQTDTSAWIYGYWNDAAKPLFGSSGHLSTIVRSKDNDAGDGIDFQSYAGGSLMYILNTGNVGIGTTNPTDKLYISEGNLTLNGSSEEAIIFTPGESAYLSSIYVRNEAGTGAEAFRIFTRGDSPYADTKRFGITSAEATADVYFVNSNVGIGTTTPANTLDVRGVGNFSGTIYINNATDITTLTGSGDLSNYAVTNESETFDLNLTVSDSVIATKAIYGPGSFVVDGAGNVGIGTTNPVRKLDVAGDIALNSNYLRLSSNDQYYIYGNNNQLVYSIMNEHIWKTWQAADGYAERMRIQPNGNVGIGTTNPGAKLEVDGTFNATGASGVTGLYVENSGEVGIGTASPGQKLTIEGSSPIAELRTGGYLMLRPSGNDWDMRLRADGVGSNAYLSVYSGGDLVNPRMVVTAPGSVGIGTLVPTHTLSVVGTMNVTRAAGSAGGIEVDSTGNVIIRLG